MSVQLLVPPHIEADGRKSRHYPCEVQTTCQPPSAWNRDPWPAVIRTISTDGLSLRLARRFERGSGLAIELPTEDGSMTTVLARVDHVESGEGGWLLHCNFISELSDEEVRGVLDLDPLHHASLHDPDSAGRKAAPPVSGVLFQTRLGGEVLRWYVKRLDPSGSWPPPDGKVVSFRLRGEAGATHSADLILTRCRLVGSYWIIDCRFRDEPPVEVLRALVAPAAAV